MADPDRTIPSGSSGATSDDGQTSESGTTFLTGTPVFDGRLVEVIQNHLRRAPEAPSARLGRRLPAKLERVVLECLERNRAAVRRARGS